MNKQRGNVKRSAASLMLGLVSTLAVAWGGLCYVPYPQSGYPSQTPPPSFLVRKSKGYDNPDGRGIQQVHDPTWTLSVILPPRQKDMESMSASEFARYLSTIRTEFETTGGLDAFMQELQANKESWGYVSLLVSGWPFKAVKTTQVEIERPAVSKISLLESSTGKVNTFEIPRFVERLPMNPIWHGLLLDVVIHGAVWFALLSLFSFVWNGLKWVEGQMRRGREKCPKCGYELQGLKGSTCPECGASVGEKTALHRKVF